MSGLLTAGLSLGLGVAFCLFGQIGYRFGYKQGNWDGKVDMIRAMRETDDER